MCKLSLFARFFLILSLLASSLGHAENAPAFNMVGFSEIPVQHEGRVKPLESFARAHLLIFSGRSSVDGMGATAWLAELLLDPEKAYTRPVFNIPNPDVIHAIGLEERQKRIYNFDEIEGALEKNLEMVSKLGTLPDSQLSLPQQQLLDLYFHAGAYAVLSESVSLLLPRFFIENEKLAEELGVPVHTPLTFLELMPHDVAIMEAARSLRGRDIRNFSKDEKERALLILNYMQMSEHRKTAIFRIVPPQWKADGDTWMSPWRLIEDGSGSPQTAAYLDVWKKMAVAYMAGDGEAWGKFSTEARDMAYRMAGAHASAFRQKLEVLYLKTNPFILALGIYLAVVALLAIFYLSQKRNFYKAAIFLMPVGAFLHLAGVITRIIIMARPPVATLYETTLFVSLIAMTLALIFEWKKKDATALMVGASIGSVLLFISTRYALDGDSMQTLVAVLNTNFWLATHVVAITTGYGCSLVAGTLAHIYLVSRFAQPTNQTFHRNIMNSMLAVGLIAALFALTGTILGGIWADQSWGRFWGWDPKENGAMLVVLWLLWLLHGRLAGVLSPLGFASGMVGTNIIVALAWFGVNLLSIGLHSYGFTSSIAANLGIFCGLEILFLVGMRVLIARKTSTTS